MRTNLTLLLILGILIVILIMIGTCKGKGCPEVVVKTDTIRDTAVVILPGEVSTVHVPKLVREVDTLIEFLPSESIDYAESEKFYTIRKDYTDTVRFREGRVVVNNSVYRNMLISQQVFLDSVKQLTVTNTITNTIREQPKGKLFFGVGGNFTPIDTTMGLNASILWQTKKGYGLELGVGLNSRSAVTYGFKYLIPLKK
jgi:hypothetical protein